MFPIFEADMSNGNKALEQSTFRKLSRLYIIALSAIALSIIVSQLLVQSHLRAQLGDSHIVNVAGRQRMLSQKLVKEVLLFSSPHHNSTEEAVAQLKANLILWQEAHRELQQGTTNGTRLTENSSVVKSMFEEINPYFSQMVKSIQSVLDTLQENNQDEPPALQPFIDDLLINESPFLQQMDQIVAQYDKEATTKVNQLRRIELLLLFIALAILVAELFFLFRPTALRMQGTIDNLVEAENSAKKMAREVEELYKTKEQSLNELRALNFAVDQAALFASATTDGKVVYLSKKFKELLGIKDNEIKGALADLMSANEGEQEYIKTLLRATTSTIWNGEIQVTTYKQDRLWLEMSIVPVNRSGVKQDLLILCSNITSRKRAQLEIDHLKEKQFQEVIQQQKILSAQVVEAQEEERKRIARDMHDGIGQMLTALRFNLQSIDLNKLDQSKQKLAEINDLATGLIRGVRIATFNLTPPELSDYGISPGLQKLASELNKLTGKQILFENRTQFSYRFDSITETNLYRITQEAVNNAIKYAESNYILITLSHSEELLSIVVDDDGKGFDPNSLKSKTVEDGSGMGISFMRERVNFINGRLFIHSGPEQGTRITINIPIPEKV